jgi:hypothetical protein
MTTQGVSGHRPLPLHLQLLLAPPLNLPMSRFFFFFSLTNGLFAYCSLPPPLAVLMPPPLGVDSLSPASTPLPSRHVDPPLPSPRIMLTPCHRCLHDDNI